MARRSTATALVLAGLATALVVRFGCSANSFNHELGLVDPPLAHTAPRVVDPRTPRLARRVFVVLVDGLRLAESAQPYFDELRRRGASTFATAEHPTWSRPNYVTILTGATPEASGIRHNRMPGAVQLDSLMDRARAAGLRVSSATDLGMLANLFLRGAPPPVPTSHDLERRGDVVLPPPELTWPFDDVRHARSLADLAASTASLVDGGTELVLVLAGDADRAGHKHGGDSPAYRDAAAAIDRALAGVFAKVDLARDAIVITSDHGHSARGGHGGDEPEVVATPLILAGAGVRPGIRHTPARLADVAPTVAALLGVPAPGHGEGRTLVELLELEPAAGRARLAADLERLAVVAEARAAARPGSGPAARPLALACMLALALGVALRLGPHVVRVGIASLAGALAAALMALGFLWIVRFELTPTAVPNPYTLVRMLALAAVGAVGAQLVATWWLVRRRPDGLARVNGVAITGLALAALPVLGVRAWFDPPHLVLPEPVWLVVLPALDVAAAASCLAIALALVLALAAARTRRAVR